MRKQCVQRLEIGNENDFSREQEVWSIWKVPVEKNKIMADYEECYIRHMSKKFRFDIYIKRDMILEV